MQRAVLLGLLDGFKARAGGVEDFTINVTESEGRAVAITLMYFKAEGIIGDSYRHPEPDDCSFEIEGYTG